MQAVGFLADHDAAADAQFLDDALDQSAHVRGQLGLLGRRARRDGRHGSVGRGGDDPRRRVPDAEQAALALGDDLEPDRVPVDPRPLPLELAQRRPLRLADGLSRRFDEQILGHRRARFFFLRTTRGWPAGFGGGFAAFAPSAPSTCFLGRRPRGSFRRRDRLRRQPARDQALPDRPEVRRHPVEDEAGRKVGDQRDERDRQRHHDPALRLVHRRGHEVRRRDLARGVDEEQQVARPVAQHAVRDARDDVEPREVSEVAARIVGLVREVPQDVEERDEDRELRQQRQARRSRVDVVLLVELHQLLVHLVAVALVLPLDLLHLRRVRLQVLHRVDLPDDERDEADADEDRQRDDRPRPAETGAVVEEVEDRPEEVLERRERAEARITRNPLRRGSRGCSAGAASPP